MKRSFGFFITLVLSTVVFSVMAQNEQSALRELVERNTYGDNWFVSLNANANLLTAEQDAYAPVNKRVTIGGALDFGKWFNPNFGSRIQLTGGALRGINDVKHYPEGYYTKRTYPFHDDYPIGGIPNPDINSPSYNGNYKYYPINSEQTGFWQEFNYASATLDLMANFTNLMRGHYRENSPIDFIPFVGIGAIYAFDNNVTTPRFYHWVMKLGFRLNFNVTNNFAIYLEPQGSATTDEFDGYSGTAFGDGVVNLGLGLQYTFNKRYTSLAQLFHLTADEIDRLNKKINDNRYLIENHQDILERQQNLLDRLEKCCDENNKKVVQTQVIETGGCLPEYVRFSIDSYKIEPIEQQKIAEVANYLKKNPDSKVLMIGYADKRTGNPRYNFNLSKKRVDGVTNELRRLGVSANRIFSEWKGDKEQPFPQNEWNRVVVLVERK